MYIHLGHIICGYDKGAEYPWGGDDSFFMSVDGAGYFCPGWPAWGAETNTDT